jgi:hypothetical protein
MSILEAAAAVIGLSLLLFDETDGAIFALATPAFQSRNCTIGKTPSAGARK